MADETILPPEDKQPAEDNNQGEDQQPLMAKSTRSFMSYIVKGDPRIWSIYFILICISVVEMFSASSQLTFKASAVTLPAFSHMRNLVIGFFIMLFAQRCSLKATKMWGILLFVFGSATMLGTFFFGHEQKGAMRSMGFFQPIEFLKVATVMFMAYALTLKDDIFLLSKWFQTHTQGRRVIAYLLILAVPLVIVGSQNLSSCIIICLTIFSMMFLGKVRGKYLWTMIGAAVVGGGLFLAALYGIHCTRDTSKAENTAEIEAEQNQSDSGIFDKLTIRLYTWSNRIYGGSDVPLWERDPNGTYSQEIHSHMAIANSYPFGRFIGNSQIRDHLPEAFSDYIYAIIFEEWGFLGAIFVLLLYLFLLLRCYYLSRLTDNLYIKLLIVGLPLLITIQALIHIGVCTGAMFVTGQPLPLISRGGSSIVVTSFAFGIILAMSQCLRPQAVSTVDNVETQRPAPIIPLPLKQQPDGEADAENSPVETEPKDSPEAPEPDKPEPF